MKKIRHIALALMLLQLTACGGDKTPQADDSTQPETSSETVGEETKDEISDDLPETDLEGYEFRIMALSPRYIKYVYSDEQDGSLMNDAVYKKCRAVEDRFNCKIMLADGAASIPEDARDDFYPIKTPVLAGEDAFDIATGHDLSMANFSLEGYFENLCEIPYLNFDKPWWPKFTMDSLTVNGRAYLFSNNISYEFMSDTRVMFFNKKIVTDMNLDMPYELVYDGKWTLDKMGEMSASAYVDLNGNSEIDEGDRFGFVNQMWYAYLEAFNLESYCEGSDGNLSYVFDTDKYQKIIDKFYSMTFSNGGLFNENAVNIFSEGKALFTYQMLDCATTDFSQSDVQYGILPMPKLDENQSQYYGGMTDRPYGVPVTAHENIDKIGLIIEALSAEGYKTVYPAYFEQALKARYSDQTDDANMIDIVCGNDILAFSYIYGKDSPFNSLMYELLKPGVSNPSVASYAAKKEKSQKSRVEKLNTFFHGN